MKIEYEIPKHLEGILGNIPEESLQKLITVVFEYAIQHRMLDYPKLEIEKEVTNIKQICLEMRSKQLSEYSLILQLLTDIYSRIGDDKPAIKLPNLKPREEYVEPPVYEMDLSQLNDIPSPQPSNSGDDDDELDFMNALMK